MLTPLRFVALWAVRLLPSPSLCFYLCCRTEQREVRAQPAALVSFGSLHAALRWASDGLEPSDSSLPAVPTARVDLEGSSGTLRKGLLEAALYCRTISH